MVFVCDSPSTTDFAQTDREAKIQFSALPVGSGFGAMHRRDDKGNVARGRDIHRSNVEDDRITGTGKKQLPGRLVGFDALGLKRWRNIEHHDVRRMTLQYRFKISATYGSCPRLNHIANCPIVL